MDDLQRFFVHKCMLSPMKSTDTLMFLCTTVWTKILFFIVLLYVNELGAVVHVLLYEVDVVQKYDRVDAPLGETLWKITMFDFSPRPLHSRSNGF